MRQEELRQFKEVEDNLKRLEEEKVIYDVHSIIQRMKASEAKSSIEEVKKEDITPPKGPKYSFFK